MNELLAPDFKNSPYWWNETKLVPISAPTIDPSYDVGVVGAGYTGLRAALELLRSGRSVIIFDAKEPGFGASRRNAGFLGRVLKKSFVQLEAKKGLEFAKTVYREVDEAYQSTMAFIESEGIDCHAIRCGRFVGATSAAHYEQLATELEAMRRHLGFQYHMLPKAEQHREMATDIYEGGAVIPDLGALHPGLYHRALLDRVVAAGGVIVGQTEVTEIKPTSGLGRFRLMTKTKSIAVRDVIIATNGYTPRNFAWHSRRLIPFTGYMAATELMPPDALAATLPHRRTVIDSNTNIDFFRPAPNEPRLLFGGATGSGLEQVDDIARRLKAILTRVFPSLSSLRLSHIWTGQCASTFDMMPHIGCHDGIWYGMGYNFAGISMGSHFGFKLGQKILGLTDSKSVFESSRFPTMLLYDGRPWFVPMAMRFFDWQDRRLASTAPKQSVN